MGTFRKIVGNQSITFVSKIPIPQMTFEDLDTAFEQFYNDVTFSPFCSSKWRIKINPIAKRSFIVLIESLKTDTGNHTIEGLVNIFVDDSLPSSNRRIIEKTESFSLDSNDCKFFIPAYKIVSLFGSNDIPNENGNVTLLPDIITYISIVFKISSICDCIKLSTEKNDSSNTLIDAEILQEAQSSIGETTIGFSQLSTDLLNFFSSKDSADVNFKIGADTIHAHKFILCARSSVFRNLFENQMHEKLTKTIIIEDSKKEDFLLFLRFLYSGALEERDVDKIRALYYLADKYEVKSLQDICQRLLSNKLAECNACDILLLAEMHSDKILKKAAIQYICEHFKNIQPSEKWKHLVEVSPALASNIVYSLALNFSALKTS